MYQAMGKWLDIENKFQIRWNFPYGIDGKQIVIEQPFMSGSHGTDSIVLLGMIGPEYEVLYVDVGINGRNSSLEANTVNLP